VRDRGSAVELAQRERGAPKLAVAEALDRPLGPDGDRVVLNRGYLGEFVLEVSRPDPVGEHHVSPTHNSAIAYGTDRVKQLPTRVDSVGDRD
jgi:hypothetical protein